MFAVSLVSPARVGILDMCLRREIYINPVPLTLTYARCMEDHPSQTGIDLHSEVTLLFVRHEVRHILCGCGYDRC